MDEIIMFLELEAVERRRRLAETEDQIDRYHEILTAAEARKAADEAYLATITAAIDAIRAALA